MQKTTTKQTKLQDQDLACDEIQKKKNKED